MSDIKITNLRKSYGAVEVLKDIDLHIRSGEFVIFVGPSGCGKSTLLRCIAGLERISGGTLEIGGRVVNNVPASRRGIAMVFQSYALYPHMSVRQNMAYSIKLRRAPPAEIESRVTDAARKLQLEPYLDRYPKELSGGQRQRVAICRAIVRDPQVFLFDEPLSNLDAALRVATRLEIARLKDSLPQTTMVYVTHDQVEAMTLADRIIVLNAGRVEQVGTPKELYERPQSRFVAGFVGSPKMNFIPGEDGTIIGIRPEDIILGAGQHRGKVSHVEYLGADSFVFLDTGRAELLTVRQTRSEVPAIGALVAYDYDAELTHRFDDEGRRL
ncbi:ABC transporter ATP-binding protein [Devosia faecipullorum]|uniref:ABC transporter ATP-binding protein n=1 Tax=Devosia faecipullorum TaxID=2755039 RepID=UPI00187B85A6|nr:ATP-binding cassette domain-containing protein [Devosia faecipullorum]MBE7733743.1 ATP-binding cassette domain-containing protein [Devosia faecipullorum]